MVEGSLREFLERASRLTGIRQQQRVHSPSRGDTASGRHIASFEQLASRCPCTSCCREGDDVVELHRVTDRHVKQMKGMKPKKLHEVRTGTLPRATATISLAQASCAALHGLLPLSAASHLCSSGRALCRVGGFHL